MAVGSCQEQGWSIAGPAAAVRKMVVKSIGQRIQTSLRA